MGPLTDINDDSSYGIWGWLVGQPHISFFLSIQAEAVGIDFRSNESCQ